MCESAIFLKARRLSSTQRQRFLDDACGTDSILRADVDELLAADEEHTIVREWKDYQRDVACIPLGTVFAERYRLVEKIGEGGMGTVYLADQFQPVQRRVAVKLLHSCITSSSTLARFEQERQALALMDHPNIAKVFDAGVAKFSHREVVPLIEEQPCGLPAASYPYLVMEFIEGLPITEYCCQQGLTLRQRVQLLLPVCHAIQHAHQKGIIHRDLKPSNIIVGIYDGEPIPKVIDFGVAKATESKLTERSICTEIGSLVGTLEYMSPEQAHLNNLDIDTRTDIYALGVILYELLTGTVPFHRYDLEKAGLIEMLRIIKEVAPPKPSTRLSKTGLPQKTGSSATPLQPISRSVPSDLDCIVMKALEKDREQRYDSANVFALDLQHYLDNEPILARPPSAGYRLRKLVQKNWGKLLVASLLLTALLTAVVGTTWGLIQANEQREKAEFHATVALGAAQQEREAREKAVAAEKLASQQRQKAIEAQKNATAISNFFLNDVIRQASSQNQRQLTKNSANPNLTVKDALYQAADRLEGKFDGQELLEASVRQALGESFLAVGEYEKAERQVERAVAIREAKLGKNHKDTLASRAWLSFAMLQHGNQKRSLDYLEKLLPDQQKKFGAESTHVITTNKYLASAYSRLGFHDKAISMYEDVYAIRKNTLGETHPDTLSAYLNIAVAHHAAGHFTQALEMYQKSYHDKSKKHGREHVTTLRALEYVAQCLMDMGQCQKALPIFEKMLISNTANAGAENPRTLRTSCYLGWCLARTGQAHLATIMLKKTHSQQADKIGANHDDTLLTASYLAQTHLITGQLQDAIALHHHVAAARKSLLGSTHQSTITAQQKFAWSCFVTWKKLFRC